MEEVDFMKSERSAVRWAQDQPLHRNAHQRLDAANPALLNGLRAYFMIGRTPGDFLRAALVDSFTDTLARAGDTSRTVLRPLMIYLKNYPPGHSWGSEREVLDWSDGGGLYGMQPPEIVPQLFQEFKL